MKPRASDKFWCLRTHNYITAIPKNLPKPKEREALPEPAPQISYLDLLIGFLTQTLIVYFAWNYGLVPALTFVKPTGIVGAILIAMFLNLLRVKR